MYREIVVGMPVHVPRRYWSYRESPTGKVVTGWSYGTVVEVRKTDTLVQLNYGRGDPRRYRKVINTEDLRKHQKPVYVPGDELVPEMAVHWWDFGNQSMRRRTGEIVEIIESDPDYGGETMVVVKRAGGTLIKFDYEGLVRWQQPDYNPIYSALEAEREAHGYGDNSGESGDN